jgi:diketogulonate reductase-like aldo/keto reductase
VIGMGTSGSFEVDMAGREPLKEVLRRFVAGGASVIDTSPNYSNAEDVLGDLLAESGLRDRIFLATKLAADDRAAGEAQFAQSLKRLRTDKVELLAVHNLRDWRNQLALARDLKAAGKTRYIGLTHFRDEAHGQLAEIMAAEKPDFIQVNYSVSAPNAERALLPLARDLGVAVMVNRAFDDGRLFTRAANMRLPGWAAEVGVGSWAQMFLRFAISHPAVTVVIPATGKPDRQSDNLKAGTGPVLKPAECAELIAMFA